EETVTVRYNDFRRETVTVNQRGGTRQYRFDAWGNPIRIVEENGAVHQYAYDPANPYNRISKTDPLNQVTSYQYDAIGNVVKINLPSQRTHPPQNDALTYFDFNGFNQPQRTQDARGHWTVLKYDTQGNLTETLRLKHGAAVPGIPYTPVAGDLASWTVNGYDAYGNPVTVKRIRDFAGQIANAAGDSGPILTTGYDANALYPVSLTRHGDRTGDGIADLPDDVASYLVYDNLGRPRTGIDGDWQMVRTVYDADDKLIRANDAVSYWYFHDMTYDPNGNLEEDRLNLYGKQGDSQVTTYDGADRRSTRIDAGGNVTRYAYDTAGNLTQLIDPDGYTVGFDYDAVNRVIARYDGEGRRENTVRDAAGRVKTTTDANGNVWTQTYWDGTRAGRLRQIVQPQVSGFGGQRAQAFDYDAHGNLTQFNDLPADGGAAQVSLNTYDALDRLVRQVGPVYIDQDPSSFTYNLPIRPVTRQVYDNLGRLVAVMAGKTTADGGSAIDPDTGASGSDTVSTQVSYVYDDFGRKLQETDANGQSTGYTYGVFNNLWATTYPNGHTLHYIWGHGHQLLSVTAEDGRNLFYTRNPLGQVTRAETWSAAPSSLLAAYDYRYDASHRLQSVTDSRGNKTLSYDYSPGGRLNYVQDSDGNRTDYRYDSVGRFAGVWAPNYDYVQFDLDDAGRLVQKRYPSGATTRYDWNPDNSLKQVSHQNGAAILAQSTYGYDGFGQRSSVSETLAGLGTLNTAYGYDNLNRLIGVDNGNPAQRESYRYDPLGNRVLKQVGGASTAYVYDSANQLIETHAGASGGALTGAFVYDNAGNLTQSCQGVGVSRTATGCTGSISTTLGWDSFNQLAQVNGASSSSYVYDDQGRRIQKTEGAVTTAYVYDGQNIHGEYPDWGAPQAVYAHAPGLDHPLSRITGATNLPTATAAYYHEDGLGSLLATSNAAGTVTASQRFGAFGNPVAQSGAIPQFGYTGREPDASGLMYYRARYYDPGIGRFISRDPIGLAGGINRYTYVGNTPINKVDPLGLDGEGAARWAEEQVGSMLYNRLIPHSGMELPFCGIGSYKCNIFVNDALVAGGNPPPLIDNRPALAGEWANPNIKIQDYVVVQGALQRGDIIAVSLPGNENYSGHVGIYVPQNNGSDGTVSVSSREDKVVHNDWGFRPDDPPATIRRWVGDEIANTLTRQGATDLNSAVWGGIMGSSNYSGSGASGTVRLGK
ncbi:MAG: hypothetical protein PHE55_12760, partial [Methylococcaceae bacterium]|nr:hypothetical protein [Methylococcaceae bacterium]